MLVLEAGCRVTKEEAGEAPEIDVEVDPGKAPEYDVEGPDIEVGAEERKLRFLMLMSLFLVQIKKRINLLVPPADLQFSVRCIAA